MDEIVSWKNRFSKKYLDLKYENRVKFPEGMISGLYKYIVFDKLEKSSGKVYDVPCHKIMGSSSDLPNTDWVSKNHWCVPLYYTPELEI